MPFYVTNNCKRPPISATALLIAGSICQMVCHAQSASTQTFKMPDASFIQTADSSLSAEVPLIVYRDKPSSLVWIDGDPVITIDTILRMYRILNTPQLIIKNHHDQKYYLYSDQGWYRSDSATKGYVYKKVLPPVIQLMDSLLRKRTPRPLKRTSKPVIHPQIIVSSVPAALIYTEGKPVWATIEGTGLEYISNTPFDIFRDTSSHVVFATISGRWYSTRESLDGPWSFVGADQLPSGFLKIPETASKSRVLVHVGGTAAAQRAVANAAQFRSRKVARGVDSSVAVVYDGGAEFASLFGSELFIAQNSNIPVFSYRNIYYALRDAVWYSSNGIAGPWSVSTQVPPDIDKLPSTSPFYYARYVRIADTTESYVETGFTGGYQHTYIQHNTVVYGTGNMYQNWCRSRLFLRPVTWLQVLYYDTDKGWTYCPAIRYYRCSLP